MRRIYHIGVSGGKDSTALLLWMVNESGIPREEMIATFRDTQNEARDTYDHIAMLSAAFSLRIISACVPPNNRV